MDKKSTIMKIRTFCISLLTLASLHAVPLKNPNILFIVSEDNSDHLGCYGEKRVHTPALDSLAKSGIRYTRAYVPYSVCSPSRSAFLTGLYTRQTGHIGLATHKFSMYRDFKTIPAYFKEAGYYSGFLGKTHVNPERIVEDFIDLRAIRQSNFSKTTSIEAYAKQAKQVMVNAAKEKKPFCLIINYADAHRKLVGKSKHGFPTIMVNKPIKPFPWIGSDTPHLREEIKNYFNCMNRLDEAVGMVLKDMKELKVRDNTLIIYIADHGADFPRAKGSIYENGNRIPMIINYPKAFSKGKVETQMVCSIDILPTMLAVSGLKIPEELPGKNLLAVDQGEIKGHAYIHTFTTGSAPALHYPQFGIRDNRYKLVYNPYRHLNHLAVSRYRNSKISKDEQVETFLHPDEYELYDLKNDSNEWKNLAKSPEHRKKLKELIAAMKSFQKEIKDPFLYKKNLDFFNDEQLKHRKINYRKMKGFRWPHLKLFEEMNE